MKLIFDTKGNEKQKEAARFWADHEVNVIVYGGSKMSGKSYLGCSLIFGDAFTYPGTFYFIARKSLNDLRKFTIPSIYEVFRHWGISEKYYKFNGQDSYFELYNGSRVYLLDAKYLPSDPEYMRFGSMQMTRGWIEEGGEFSLAAKNNLQASIGRWRNKMYQDPRTGEYYQDNPNDKFTLIWDLYPKLLITCNPAHNFLYSDFYKLNRDGVMPKHLAFVQALPQDNKMMTQEYYENLYRSLTIAQRKRLLFGQWEYDDDENLLVDFDAVCDVFTNDHVLPDSNKYLSADLAMKGRDRFVGISWNGLVGTIDIDMKWNEAQTIENMIRDLQLQKGISKSRTVADSDGLGAFLSGYIKGITEFHGNARAVNSQMFFNLKSECAYKLADLINARAIKIICTKEQEEILKEELMMLRAMDAGAEGKKRLISKDEMKDELGHSPDYLDALIMRMVYELISKPTGMKKIKYKYDDSTRQNYRNY